MIEFFATPFSNFSWGLYLKENIKCCGNNNSKCKILWFFERVIFQPPFIQLDLNFCHDLISRNDSTISLHVAIMNDSDYSINSLTFLSSKRWALPHPSMRFFRSIKTLSIWLLSSFSFWMPNNKHLSKRNNSSSCYYS